MAISRKAQNAEAKMRPRRPKRTLGNLPSIRSKTRASITPLVEKMIRQHDVTLESTLIGEKKCTVVIPKEIQTSSVILYFFGGGFVTGSAFEDLTIAIPIANQTKAQLIIPEYRLAPEAPWPAALEDCFLVYEHISDWTVALVGESAGGNLALGVTCRAKRSKIPLPKAIALLSPWCNLLNTEPSLSFNDGKDPSLCKNDVQMAARHYASESDLTMEEISPLFHNYKKPFPPVYISTASRDLLLDQSKALANKLIKKKILVDITIAEGMWHVFEWDSELPESIASLVKISKFLKKNMKEISI